MAAMQNHHRHSKPCNNSMINYYSPFHSQSDLYVVKHNFHCRGLVKVNEAFGRILKNDLGVTLPHECVSYECIVIVIES